MKQVLVVMCLSLFLCTGLALAKDTTPPKGDVVVAQVGPYKLTKAEFEEMVKNAPPSAMIADPTTMAPMRIA